MAVKLSNFIIAASILLLFASVSSAQTIQYLSPRPDSRYNAEKSTIIVGFDKTLEQGFIKAARINVSGSKSGMHTGTIIPVEGNTKLIFKPDVRFAAGETVTITGLDGKLNYEFRVSSSTIKTNVEENIKKELRTDNVYLGPKNPDEIPSFVIVQDGPTSSGYLFFSNFSNSYVSSYLLAINNNGTPYFSKLLAARGYDFKRQPNNTYTYFDEMKHFYLGLDANFQVVDSFYCSYEYATDFHEARLETDGSAWLMAYNTQIIDMSQIVPGGKLNAQVTGLIIQKINPNKEVVFQWSSWDHIPITDATHENLQSTSIDYVHGNAIEPMDDNSILLSSRHLDEITKISTNTGEIIWRLGGKQNQFTFINDTIKFSHQHSINYLGDNHYLLFDNGNYHTPSFSRAVEYKLEETSMTATKVWEYRNNPNIYSYAMGSVQRLANGNTLIGWGSASTTISEVNSQGQLLYQLSLPAGQMSYRAFRFEPILATNEGGSETAVDYTLSQNYPNPFNPSTTIKFSLQEASFVNLSIYDITGKKVSELINRRMQAGQYAETWNASNFTSGVYFYVLSSDKFSSTKKMILLK